MGSRLTLVKHDAEEPHMIQYLSSVPAELCCHRAVSRENDIAVHQFREMMDSLMFMVRRDCQASSPCMPADVSD